MSRAGNILWILAAATLAYAAMPPRSVMLEWEYPTNQLTSELTFKIYTHTNISAPLTNWSVLTNVVGTNLSTKFMIEPGQRFYYMTASNFWGESVPSNTVGTPAVPIGDMNPKIKLSN